jgi:hypothetical protein
MAKYTIYLIDYSETFSFGTYRRREARCTKASSDRLLRVLALRGIVADVSRYSEHTAKRKTV